jgi:hypothetical protein
LWSLSFWLSHQYPICILLITHSCYMPWSSHPLGEKLHHCHLVHHEAHMKSLGTGSQALRWEARV